MRIIAGDFKKRRLQGPPDDSVTRPIPDLVKESLFNILRGHCEDGPVLDCFAGTGSIGLEALSRGAPHCTFVERDKKIAQILKANIEHCQASNRSELVIGDALGPGALSRCPRPLHQAFFDPPYPLVRDKAGLARVKAQIARVVAILDETGYAVLRTPWPLFHDAVVPASPDGGDGEVHAGEGSYAGHHRREHMRGGDMAAPERPGKRTRRSPEPRARRDGKGARPARGGTRGARRSTGEVAGPDGANDPHGLDDMEEIEIDLSTAEGQALLQRLMDAGAIDPADEGEEVEGDEVGNEAASGRGSAAPDGPREIVRVVKRPPGERADLSIPGTIGPETHPYSGMAVHLYMRSKG